MKLFILQVSQRSSFHDGILCLRTLQVLPVSLITFTKGQTNQSHNPLTCPVLGLSTNLTKDRDQQQRNMDPQQLPNNLTQERDGWESQMTRRHLVMRTV